ncbi:short chain dehydrogenase [Xylariaceae sp. FL0255]|nr:short chain dehydrogenase [Xylariaceae sp. FL0255]
MSATRVILVTAGSAGLGAKTARCFANNGFRVVVNYNSSADKAAEVLKSLPTIPEFKDDTHACIKANLESRTEAEGLVAAAREKMGRLDVIFSNGGWTRFRDIKNLDDNVVEEEWDRAFNMNVKSHLWLIHAAKAYLEATEGCFILTSSVAGVHNSGSSLAYSVTKAAQLHLMKSLASTLGPKIRVNSVSPGLLQTEWSERFSPEFHEAYRQKTKLKRIVELEDVAQQVLTFANSRSMTGVNVVIDSGFTL